jgi:hypothetical protein
MESNQRVENGGGVGVGDPGKDLGPPSVEERVSDRSGERKPEGRKKLGGD